jgi:hypothetical protein
LLALAALALAALALAGGSVTAFVARITDWGRRD